MMNNSIIYLGINILFYALALYWVLKKSNGRFPAISFVVVWYLFAAISSLLFYTHPFTASTEYYRDIEWKGLVYFNILTLILMLPLYKFEHGGYEIRSTAPVNAIFSFMKALLFINIVVIVSYIPDAIRILNSGSLGDIRDIATHDGTSTISPKHPLIAWMLTFSMSFRNICTIVAFYSIVFIKCNRKLVLCFFIVSMLMPFFLSLLFVMRSYMVFQILLVFFLFLLFREKFSETFRKRMYIGGGLVLGVVIFLLVFISDDRFGDMVTWFYYKYAGETFVNYAGQLWPDLSGTTGGTVYFEYFNKILGNSTHSFNLSEKWDYMNYMTGVDTHIFYGFIGGLNLEFGFVYTAILILTISWLFSRNIKSNYWELSNLILIGSLANLLFTGSFLFNYQGLWGNLEIVLVIMSFIYLKRKEQVIS